jgi:hypothetical protein
LTVASGLWFGSVERSASLIEFSSGNQNQTNGGFVGVGNRDTATNEANVAQIMATNGTVTSFTCYQAAPASAAKTFTLRKGTISGGTITFADTTWTCTIATGNRSGTGTSSGTTTFVAGDTLEVHLPAAADNVVATFGVGYGPTP